MATPTHREAEDVSMKAYEDIFGGAGMNPNEMISGLPSFAAPGGDALSSASANQWATMNSPFTINTGGGEMSRTVLGVAPILMAGGVAWMAFRK